MTEIETQSSLPTPPAGLFKLVGHIQVSIYEEQWYIKLYFFLYRLCTQQHRKVKGNHTLLLKARIRIFLLKENQTYPIPAHNGACTYIRSHPFSRWQSRFVFKCMHQIIWGPVHAPLSKALTKRRICEKLMWKNMLFPMLF